MSATKLSLRFLTYVFFAFSSAALLLLAGCGGGGHAGTGGTSIPPAAVIPIAPGIQTSTTLQAETANNTAAVSSLPGNGNAPPGNVSKLPTRSLLYSGSATKIYASLLPWFGGSNHQDVGYNSSDPAEVHRQVQDMISRGIQGAVIDWFGPNDSLTNSATMAFKTEVEANSGFEFSIMEDMGALFTAAQQNNCNVTDQLISDLNFIATNFENSPAYTKFEGRPVIFFFGVNAFFIDWNRVRATVGNNPIFLFRGVSEGLQQSFSTGGFQWVDITVNDPFNNEIGAQEAFYTVAKQTGRTTVGSTYKGFNDTLAMFGTNRLINQNCGQTWLQTFGDIAKFFSSSDQLQALQIVTWNDYEEGTAVEPGIDNCVFLQPFVVGNTLSWSVQGGSENTIDHYTVFASPDGQNLAVLADVPAGTTSVDLTKFGLGSGTFTLFVKAVGRPSIQNKMSAGIGFHAGDQPPHASMTLSQPSSLTLSATTQGSSDPDGSIASSQIDFGDGTVLSGPTATHTYSAPGDFIVTGRVTDNTGVSAVVVQRASVRSTAPGVTIFSPANGATVNWPTQIVASANSGAPISVMKIFIDNQQAFAIDRDFLNTPLKIFSGTHHVVVQAFDASGGNSSAAIDVSAEPNDIPPTAVLTVTPMPQISPTTVLACSVNSRDPDGFFISYQEKFSDGAQFFTPGALHALPGPGTFSVSTLVEDQFGLTATTSQTFNVGGMSTVPGVQTQAPALTAPSSIQVWPMHRP